MTRSRRNLGIAAVISAALIIAAIVAIGHSSHPGFLYWREKNSSLRVWLEDSGIADLDIRLVVERDGRRQDRIVLDKSSFGTARLVRRGNQILAMNDELIFAAYDMSADKIVHYRDLPITLWDHQGQVLKEVKLGDRAVMRSGFPLRTPASTTSSRP